VKRFFSHFLNSWPGVGLALLRLTLACGLLADALARTLEPGTFQVLLPLGECLATMLLVMGLWTPVTGAVVCVLQLGMALTTSGSTELLLQRAAIGLCVMFLGPGIWSIDARLFGRRRIVINIPRDQ
jgi:uncharacterized membrane protein YphA (DoxX/SURF4 family)